MKKGNGVEGRTVRWLVVGVCVCRWGGERLLFESNRLGLCYVS